MAISKYDRIGAQVEEIYFSRPEMTLRELERYCKREGLGVSYRTLLNWKERYRWEERKAAIHFEPCDLVARVKEILSDRESDSQKLFAAEKLLERLERMQVSHVGVESGGDRLQEVLQQIRSLMLGIQSQKHLAADPQHVGKITNAFAKLVELEDKLTNLNIQKRLNVDLGDLDFVVRVVQRIEPGTSAEEIWDAVEAVAKGQGHE